MLFIDNENNKSCIYSIDSKIFSTDSSYNIILSDKLDISHINKLNLNVKINDNKENCDVYKNIIDITVIFKFMSKYKSKLNRTLESLLMFELQNQSNIVPYIYFNDIYNYRIEEYFDNTLEECNNKSSLSFNFDLLFNPKYTNAKNAIFEYINIINNLDIIKLKLDNSLKYFTAYEFKLKDILNESLINIKCIINSCKNITNIENKYSSFINYYLEFLHSFLENKSIYQYLNTLFDSYKNAKNQINNVKKVISHCDLHQNNILFSKNSNYDKFKIKIIDFENSCIATLGIDIIRSILFLGCSSYDSFTNNNFVNINQNSFNFLDILDNSCYFYLYVEYILFFIFKNKDNYKNYLNSICSTVCSDNMSLTEIIKELNILAINNNKCKELISNLKIDYINCIIEASTIGVIHDCRYITFDATSFIMTRYQWAKLSISAYELLKKYNKYI